MDAFRFGGRQLEQEAEYRVFQVSAADESWTYTDRAGHSHRWKDGYPTLRVVAETHYDEDGDPYNVEHYECPLCGEEIEPGTVRKIETVMGVTRYAIDGEPVDEATFRRELEAAMKAAGIGPR